MLFSSPKAARKSRLNFSSGLSSRRSSIRDVFSARLVARSKRPRSSPGLEPLAILVICSTTSFNLVVSFKTAFPCVRLFTRSTVTLLSTASCVANLLPMPTSSLIASISLIMGFEDAHLISVTSLAFWLPSCPLRARTAPPIPSLDLTLNPVASFIRPVAPPLLSDVSL